MGKLCGVFLALFVLIGCQRGPQFSLTPTPGPTPTQTSTVPSPVPSDGVEFDDADALHIRSRHYEIVLSKDNGPILGIWDVETGQRLTMGSRNGCLWGASFPGREPDYAGGCSFKRDGPRRFSYHWDEERATLMLEYLWDVQATDRLDATVEIMASDESYFDLGIRLRNNWGAPVEQVLIPSDLVFDERQVTAAYAPFILPGVRLTKGFFSEDRSYVATYPGEAYAPYISLDVGSSYLSLYPISGPESQVQPVRLGFLDDDGTAPDTFLMSYALQTWIENGQEWSSPTIRVRIGEPARQTIEAYREDSGIAGYPSLEQKMGDKLEALDRAPLVKADITTIGKPFSQWSEDLERLPDPVLLHLVAFQAGGFDTNNPDLLPPDPRWGTTDDLRRLAEEMRERGSLVVPYTNPTWWDEGAPTLEDLPPGRGIEDIAVLDRGGNPVREEYNGHEGVVVSPHAPLVRERLDRLMEEWREDVPADCVFFDQVGARNWLLDLNPAAPSSVAYSDGWLEFTRHYADRCMMTEMGWDRLAEMMVAFHGSILTWERTSGYASRYWGHDNWEPYPLALWLFSDKVLLYQHDLDGTTMVRDRSVLTWDLAFGMMLSYVWETFTADTLESPWLELVGVLQREVAARYAGKPLIDYQYILPHVTLTEFDGLSVTANWHPYLPYRVDGYDIAPGGFLARTEDGSLLAGAFPGTGFFNGQPLSPGEHYIVVRRSGQGVTVHQPVGEDTRLYIDVPERWSAIKVAVYDAYGVYLGEVDCWHWPDDGRMSFLYRQYLNGSKVGYYKVSPSA